MKSKQLSFKIKHPELYESSIRLDDYFFKQLKISPVALNLNELEHLIHPADILIFEAYIERLYATGEPFDCQLRYLKADEIFIPLHLRVDFCYNENQSLTLIILSVKPEVKDLTKLEIATNASGHEFWETNLITGEITRKAIKIFKDLGYTEEESLANINDFSSFIHPDDLPNLSAAIDDHYHKKTNEYRCEFRTKSKYGEWEWIANYGKIIPTDGEWGECFTGVSVNINERKVREDVIRKAEKLELMRGLIGGVAHNFNNILAALSGNLYLAKSNSTSVELNGFLEKIEQSSNEAAFMVKQLLNFIHYSMEKKHPVPIIPLFQEATEIAQLGLGKDIELITDFTNENLHVNCNPEEIKNILIQLITNARDAVEDSSEKKIIVGFKEKMKETCQRCDTCEIQSSNVVHLFIEDTGVGMTREDLDKICDPFFTKKEVGKGKGLGLSVVKGIVESHEGVLNIHSQIGVGTTVEVCLPLVAKTHD